MPRLLSYLQKYGEPEARNGEILSGCKRFGRRWGAAVALPLFKEHDLVPDLLSSLARAAHAAELNAVAILVVNGKADGDETAHLANAGLLDTLGKIADRSIASSPPVSLGSFSANLDLIVVDRATPAFRFPPEQGVGLARKIGCDIAVSLRRHGMLESDLFHTTDADARVSENYFRLSETSAPKGIGAPPHSAWLHPFLHEVGTEASLPLTLYEISLRYYVLGLTHCASPYAFHTIGSTLAINSTAYAMVRGFPRREAAEDFYILNKLAKVGTISIGGGSIRLVGRESRRVPFGTGRSMERIGQILAEAQPFLLYHPETFRCLAIWLKSLNRFCEHRDLANLKSEIRNGADSSLGKPLLDALETLHAFEALEIALRTRRDRRTLTTHLHTWFDAFRTLKLIHTLRDSCLPSLPWREALASADFLGGDLNLGLSPWEILDILRRKEMGQVN